MRPAPILLAVTSFVGVAALRAQQRAISDSDLYAFRWIASPQISPDGRQVAYVLVTVNAKHDGYETSLWIVGTDGASSPRRLTAGPRDGAPRWSRDGKTIAFTSSTTPDDLEKKKKEKTDEPKSDVRVIVQAEYRADDEGWVDPTEHSHIWTVSAAVPGSGEQPAEAHQVTTGTFDENAPQWSPDGARIYFAS